MDDITVIISTRDKDEAESKFRQVMIRAQPYIQTQLSDTQNRGTPFNKATCTDRDDLKYWRSYAIHTAKCKLSGYNMRLKNDKNKCTPQSPDRKD